MKPIRTAEDEIYKRALQFANDCGKQALGERDFGKIEQLYIEFAKDIESYTTNKIIDQGTRIAENMIREYDETKPEEEQDFDSAWNTALWAFIDDLKGKL